MNRSTGSADSNPLLVYELPENNLSAGTSLGNDSAWINSKATGAIERMFCLALGESVYGTITLRYGAPPRGIMPHPRRGKDREPNPSLRRPEARTQLEPDRSGAFRIHPAYQERTFDLPGSLSVTETLFMPNTPRVDPAVAYQIVSLRNGSDAHRDVRVFAYANLRGTTCEDVVGVYDPETGSLFAWNESHPEWVRAFGFSDPATGYMTTHDVARAYDSINVLPLSGDTSARGSIFGIAQVDVGLAPGEERTLAMIAAFSPGGADEARRIFEDSRNFGRRLEETVAHYGTVLDVSRLGTPDAIINQGAQWCKANMLRVMGSYPVARGFTNEPGVSSNVVIRDAAWFVYGNDWLDPGFSAEMLRTAARMQYPDGKIAEYYSALDGRMEDYGLNINDGTPLFILAVHHHIAATGDRDLLETLFPAVEAAARCLLGQRNEQGLVFCSARGQNVRGIASWRNVIPNYTLNGAVTEINALACGALRAAAGLSASLGRGDLCSELEAEADRLKDAVNRHLLNPDNGMYYLNIDADGDRHTDVTSDEVFPVMFRVAPEEVAYRIISRLNSPDFWTRAGLRIVSDQSPFYDPSSHVGLLGGVWPGVVFWYAFAAAKYHPEFMVRGLREGYRSYLADPRKNNTVPGQFSEWFDGESLVNRGMRLSPWEPPRYLWAAVEGLAGIEIEGERLSVNPRIPPDWKWITLSRLPYRGREITFFAAREKGALHLYTTETVESEIPATVCGPDVTARVEIWSRDATGVALGDADTLRVFIGNGAGETRVLPLRLDRLLDPGRRYRIRMLISDYGDWIDRGEESGGALSELAVSIESAGYTILRFDRIGKGEPGEGEGAPR